MEFPKFLKGRELRTAIKEVIQSGDAICVVAFVGQGSSDWITANFNCKLVCNLTSGATNPNEIETLMKLGVEVRHHEKLHAKVYSNTTRCIISSANLSANGLGLEAAEQGHWTEIGVLHRSGEDGVYAECRDWVRNIWDNAEEVVQDSDLLKTAKERWVPHRKNKPQLESPSSLNIDDLNDLPAVSYWGHADMRLSEKAKSQIGENTLDDAKFFSVDFEDMASDGDFLKQGQWILIFTMNSDGETYSKANRPHWVFVDTIIEDGFCSIGNKSKFLHLAFGTKSNRTPPIALPKNGWKQWVDVYQKICGEYDKRLENSEKPAVYFADERLKLSQKFWQEVAEL